MDVRALLALAAVCAPSGAAAAPAAPAAPPAPPAAPGLVRAHAEAAPHATLAGDRRSLEELLAEARAQREKVHAELLPRIQAAIQSLDELERRARDERAERIVGQIVSLGSDAAPLLVQFLDPGEGAGRGPIFRAEKVAQALSQLGSTSVTETLLERARSATLLGRLNAIEVLSTSTDRDRVAPALEALALETADEASNPYRPVRLAALRALARLGGPAASAILIETLQNGDMASAEGALDALIDVRVADAGGAILALAATPRGAVLASRIAAFLEAVPSTLEDDDAVEAAIQLAARDNVSREAKMALLETLRENDVKPPSAVKRELAGLRESLDQGVRRAALVYLARMKDRGARRVLFDPFEAEIRANRSSSQAYEGRAELNYLVGDHVAAIRDWREALKLQNERNGVRSAAPFIGLARSLALTGKFKDAAEYLDQAPISQSALHDLARHSDFAEMLESKYAEVFRLPETDSPRR